ncbi:MAG: XdhC family protein [Lyngbya sp. HA4199-MV5]|jgi:xanthine/CO dehydrogenase XdhC/CoxF family maturation factor|nr:XdhC family protein [Lyngbya sp. HA4199-MV5]
MNEIQAILNAYDQVTRSGEAAALATVMNTSGSTYRRPGARILIMNSGQTVGMISGGCLEQDVVEHAQQVMQSGKSIVVTYDTTANENIIWGLGLGCNGIVQILIERLDREKPFNLLLLIAACLAHQQPGVLATVFNAAGSVVINVGARLICHADHTVSHEIEASTLVSNLLMDVPSVLHHQQSIVQQYPCASGNVEVLLEWLAPPPSIVLFGAGQDAIPVARFAKALGWRVTIVDCRANEATRERFSMVDTVLLTRRDRVQEQVQMDANTTAVVMTHNYLDDAALLKTLLPSSARYIGILGPKHRTERLLQTLQQDYSINIAQARTRLHAPIGLDLGAETPEAIALAIVAEIQAVLANHAGGFLKHRKGGIHRRQETLAPESLLCLR